MPEALPESNTTEVQRMLRVGNILGLTQDVNFEQAIADHLASESRCLPHTIEQQQALLDAHSVTGINPSSTPEPHRLDALTEKDWEAVRDSPSPLLTLYAASNYHYQDQETTFIPAASQYPRHRDLRKGYEGQTNEALIRSLPLIHGMTADAFTKLIHSGAVMQSNKQRYKESDKDALAFHGAGVGATNLADRELGLDQYVFFDFGRPASHNPQQEVTLVVDQSVIGQPGVFMTEKDIADTYNASEYANGLTTPEYFHETALLRVSNSVASSGERREGGHYMGYNEYNTLQDWRAGQDADFDTLDKPHFSTYEVKIPSPPGVQLQSSLRRVIIRDPETFEQLKPVLEQLKQTLGDTFDFVQGRLERPHLERSNPNDPYSEAVRNNGNYTELLNVPGAYEEKLEEIIEADYQQRVGALNALPASEKKQAVVVFGSTDPETAKGQDPKTRLDYKTNPNKCPDQCTAFYPSIKAVYEDIRDSNDPNEFYTAANQPLWFSELFGYDKKIKTPSGSCMIAIVEQAVNDPSLSRILEVRPFSLDEMTN